MEVFKQEKMILTFKRLFMENKGVISDQIIIGMAKSIQRGFPIRSIQTGCSEFSKHLAQYINNSSRQDVCFFGKYLLHCITSLMQPQENCITFGTDGLFIGCENAIRNDGWAFETISYNFPVTGSGKYMYEVIIETLGVVQIGWTTTGFRFDSDGGRGVGDDLYSYSIDGYRAKKWHGLNHQNVFFQIFIE